MYNDFIFWEGIGYLEVIASEKALVELKFNNQEPQNHIQGNTITAQTKKELNDYFEGRLNAFSVPLDPSGTEFQKKVWKELLQVQFGQTISYQQLALNLGDEKVIRAAASANGKNPIPIIIPCHRVIGKDGSLTGYSGGMHRKKKLLQHEGSFNQMSLF
jgi:methylated-DNA-[protein]-cysteine S-methyltransferase